MKLDRIRDIANAVLYEGYILYPYRPSSIKNRQRWTFGSIFPRAFGGSSGDASVMQTQMLLQGDRATIDVHIRFLHVLAREVGKLTNPISILPAMAEPEVTRVSRLEANGKEFLAWEEAIEREITLRGLSAERLSDTPQKFAFKFNGTRELEPVRGSDGKIAAILIRSALAIEGEVEISAQKLGADTFRLTARIENLTPLPAAPVDRNAAQRQAFASTHTILEIHDGAFVSLLDPPDALRDAAAACTNQGTWPVLVGKEGDKDAVLSSPIILYDYPNVAPESPGDLFDGTEIDEILTLRILAMTDEEKREMASVDVRARALLERTHSLTADDMARLHGTMRAGGSERNARDSLAGLRAAESKPRLVPLLGNECHLMVGNHVRIRPKAGGDIMDIVLKDKIAIVEAIERDFEDRIHVAVTIVDDPGRDLGAAGFPGHRFYFGPDEIEPLAAEDRP